MLKHMRHRQLLSLALTASVGAAVILTGCSVEPILPSKSEEYSREFIKNFGVFDRTHDWNHATRTTVDITTTRPTDVKIMADYDGKRYIFGSYTNVDGQKTLDVDIPKGVTDLIVRANGHNYAVKAGGTVDFKTTAPSKSRASRTITYGTYPVFVNGAEQTITVSKTEEADWRTISCIDVRGFNSVMPESNLNIYKQNVDIDFVFRSVGPIIIYTVYWNTSQPNKLGIAIKDDNDNIHEIELWQRYRSETFDPENNLLGTTTFNKVERYEFHDFRTNETIKQVLRKNWKESLSPNDVTPAEYLEIARRVIGDNVKSVLKVNNGECNGYGRYEEGWGNGDYVLLEYITDETEHNPEIKGVGTDDGVALPSGTDGCILTKGIRVDIPVGMRYIMYIERGDGTKVYSMADYNPDPLMQRDENGNILKDDNGQNLTVEGKQAFHAATWVGPKFGWTWLGFEDWLSNEGSDMDLNDMVFLIDNSDHVYDNPVVEIEDPDDPKPEVWEWIIACEDLGTNDFDFNDVVFSVSGAVTDAQTETKTVKVKALAAGGTLPVYLYYKDKQLMPDGEGGAEFHAWFEGNHSSGTVINASGVRATGRTATVEVDSDFTMSCCMTATEGESGNMGGFKVMVEHADGRTVISATNPNIESMIGTAPQMICVPATWRWPRENVHIRTVYPDFIKWCESGHDVTIDWHNNRNGNGYFL